MDDRLKLAAQKARGGRYFVEALAADFTKPRVDESGPAGPWFYFMHIEKTAGTSLAYSLFRAYPQAQIFPNMYQEQRYFMGRHPHWDEIDENPNRFLPKDMRLLVGHFGMNPIDRFPVKPKVFTFLRDPVERAISAIEFHRRAGGRYDGLTFDEVLEKHAWADGSRQAQSFGYDHVRKDVDEALENLNKIDFVGFVDTYDSCLVRLSEFLGLEQSLASEKKNLGNRTYVPTDAQRERLVRLTEVDQALYDFAKKHYPKPRT